MREICLDTETTGLNPQNGDKIIEVAGVELIDKVRTGKFFHSYINPRREVPEEAFRIHGISTEFLQDKPIFDHVAQKFLDFIGDSKLVIHNAAFDMKFLNYELGILGLEPLQMTNVVDSLLIARKKFPGGQNSLDALCRRFNVDLSRRTKHGALLDSELLADVYIELMGGAQAGLAFGAANGKKSPEENKIELAEKPVEAKKILSKRDFAVSKEDLEKHREFVLGNIKNNLWQF